MVRCENKKAVTMVEIVIVVVLSSLIIGVGFGMMSRSNRQFRKGNDMINIQRLMDNIVERIRTDVRSLKKVVEESETKFSFVIIREGEDVTITYEYNPDEKTLYRKEETELEGTRESDFHGAKQVLSLVFKTKYDDPDYNTVFGHLDLAMQIASNDYSGNKNEASHLSIACQFYSTCVESILKPSDLD